MKRNFTVSVIMLTGIALVCLPAFGQTAKEVQAIRPSTLNPGVELRRGENKVPEVLPDSIVTYSSSGEKMNKKKIYASYSFGYEYVLYTWENNTWIYEDSIFVLPDRLSTWTTDKGHLAVRLPKMGCTNNQNGKVQAVWTNVDGGNQIIRPVNVTWNEDGQPNLIEIMYEDDHNYRGQVWLSRHFTYNENGQLISWLEYNHGSPYTDKRNSQNKYSYNADGNMILYEDFSFQDGQKMIFDYNERRVAEYDSEGRKIREERYMGNRELQKYLLNEYDVYYYSGDDTGAPAVPERIATRVWSSGGQLYIAAASAGRAQIYTVAGQLMKTVALAAGQTVATPLPPGVYIVAADGRTWKVILSRD
jgi:hypothetical protein